MSSKIILFPKEELSLYLYLYYIDTIFNFYCHDKKIYIYKMNRSSYYSLVVNLLLLLSVPHYVRGECRDTGCHHDSWRVVGYCEQYGMTELKRIPCENGHVYSCCRKKNDEIDPNQHSSDMDIKLNKRGDLTYYDLGLTACGQVYTNKDMVAAIAFKYFTTSNPNVDPICGKRVKVVDPATLKSIVVMVRDICETCKANDIDVSPTAFEKLKSKSVGRFKVMWDFI